MSRVGVLLAIVAILSAPVSAQLTICGDVDGSQRVNVLDALITAQATIGLYTLTMTQESQADVDSDGVATITDALQIAQFVVYLRDTLSCNGFGITECDAPGLAILDFQTINATINVSSTALINSDLEIDVNILHTYQGDLRVTLIHPDATQVILHDHTGGGADNIIGTYPTTLTPAQPLSVLDGKSAGGTWTLRVADTAGGDIGTLVDWCVRIGNAPITVSHLPYVRLTASRTGNNLISYPYARLTGGGIPENTIQFSAEQWSTGPNLIAEAGGGDDYPIGPLPGGTWSTTVTTGQGVIDPMSGLFVAGVLTGGGMVDYVNPTYGGASFQVAVVPPDWIP